jgi:hypothetical protein
MWNYRWSSNYGSPDFSVNDPAKQGRDELQVASARLESDGKTVILGVPGLKPAHQVALSYNLETENGEPLQSAIYATIHSLK